MPLKKGDHWFDDQFTQIKNSWLRDERLTFKARGLLAYIESHTQGWEISVQWLAANNPEGKEALRSAINELELYGYLEREQENHKGRFGEVTWTTKDPADGEPLAGNPLAENPPLKNTIDKNTIDKNIERELFDEFWAIYPKKVDKALAFRQFRKAINKVGFEDILAGVIRFANDPNLPKEKRFVKNPATWLNAEAWENPALPPLKTSGKRNKEEEKRKLDEWLASIDE